MVKIRMVKLKYSYESFITRNRLELLDAERTYLWRSLKIHDKTISRFLSHCKNTENPVDNKNCGEHKWDNDGRTSKMIRPLAAKTPPPSSNIPEGLSSNDPTHNGSSNTTTRCKTLYC